LGSGNRTCQIPHSICPCRRWSTLALNSNARLNFWSWRKKSEN